MNTIPNTGIAAGQSTPGACADRHHELDRLMARAVPAPTPAMLSETVRRTFQRKLEPVPAGLGDQPATQTRHLAPNLLEVIYAGCTVRLARMVCASYQEHASALALAGQGLVIGDIVILKSLDLSTGHCFPYHSAFGRYQEIMALYQQAIGHPTTHEALRQLSHAYASGSIIQMGVPARLDGDQRSLPAMIMEGIRPCVEKAGLVTMDEFDTVCAELRRIGQDPQTSIRSFTINRILFTL